MRKQINEIRQRILEFTKRLIVIRSLRRFTFDAVWDETSSQEEIFFKCAEPIIDAVLAGYNGTIFAYGQTGFSS